MVIVGEGGEGHLTLMIVAADTPRDPKEADTQAEAVVQVGIQEAEAEVDNHHRDNKTRMECQPTHRGQATMIRTDPTTTHHHNSNVSGLAEGVWACRAGHACDNSSSSLHDVI